ncbi:MULTISPECIES: MaoC family dehydratase [Streptomycetaceae]|uniref:MaoC domain protein dehydratase n=1 Tax=Streptantibioticus cattleyicolor (strain ATCC 35852 / DSM 46488 / JCM 4925 / NBRC 14057 / NRRL 8057) TaxID=1003195 RepID=F8JXE2_STREN|nr:MULTISPECIES: MaoC/PaaZ C-terminal domain-containing protein [Streptomycetaceae]AEW95822.1 MaoC domain protein dehydratase [Streptantibioticus cattleyicolor NRRL 8057 = DSM 46488]MYS60365.1 hypothetical protein [Streptomyces sp. SID5468]CCB76161.1 Dehydratase [Streptantibioticus cattleyicolor NRRL 8057 = DSM 46488]
MAIRTLSAAPRLPLVLAGGALASLGKRVPRETPVLDGPARDGVTVPRLTVDAARVSAYARVCGFARADPLPLTYPHVLGFPLAARLMARRDFPLPLLGLVHTATEIVRYEPLHAADPLQLTVHAAALRPHRRGTEVVVVTEARKDGRTAWRDESTYLARHRRTEQPQPPQEQPEETPLPAAATWHLPASLGRRHARVSGDYNPIHLHPLTARAFGFPRAIAHGMWTLARCVAELGDDPGPVRVQVRFTAPVLLPSTVTYATDNGRFEVRANGPGGVPGRLHLTGSAAAANDGPA